MVATEQPLAPVTLVLGGARSGKSAFAEQLAAGVGRAVYLATAEARDDEMRARIEQHRQRRGKLWRTIEEPFEIARVIRQQTGADCAVLVDCLTLWLSNIMLAGRDPETETATLLDALAAAGGPVIAVANEVGLGIVPESKLARDFRDHAGRLNQAVASVADRVFLLVAGLPVSIK